MSKKVWMRYKFQFDILETQPNLRALVCMWSATPRCDVTWYADIDDYTYSLLVEGSKIAVICFHWRYLWWAGGFKNMFSGIKQSIKLIFS